MYLLLNPTKPLHFPSNIIYKIEENSLMYKVKGVDFTSQCISWLLKIPEIVH